MFFAFDFVRRKLAEREPFPEAWRHVLTSRVPFYRRFDAAERVRFETKLKVFLATKQFAGAGGMVIDDEVKLIIGAAAARLVMNLPDEHYRRLHEVVVYKSHYKHKGERGQVVFGEAFGPGVVVLSYDAVLQGLSNPSDGHDTAIHEFAHALDAADGAFDGTPELGSIDAYGPFASVMSRAFAHLRSQAGRRGKRVLRDYGAINEAEFFAVATESFFERSGQLRAKHPELYAVLAGYYRADPAARRSA